MYPDEPPQGPPWDSALRDAPLALIDLEMTGLEVGVDRVIEICVERWRAGAVERRLETLVNPGADAPFHTRVHGIEERMLLGAPSFGEVASEVRALLDGAILVAHAAAWDVAFLEAELARIDDAAAGPSPDRTADQVLDAATEGDAAGCVRRREPWAQFHLDTLTLSRRAMWADSHALTALATTLGLSTGPAGPHRAGSDVHVLSQLFDRLVAALRPSTPRDLWQVRVGEKRVRPEVLAACVQLAGTGQVAEICYRPSRKPPRKLLGIVREVRTELDPPRVMGYALPDRGRFELRADRILWAESRPSPNPDTQAP